MMDHFRTGVRAPISRSKVLDVLLPHLAERSDPMRPIALFALVMSPLLLATRTERTPGSSRATTSLLVTPEWLAQHQDDPDLVILEVGEGAEYKSGHIRRARPVDIMALHGHGGGFPEPAHFVAGVEALGISNASRIVLYGDNMSTSLLWVMFEYMGLGERTRVLDGGRLGWTTAGKPLSREEPTYLAGKFVPHLRPDILVDAAWLSGHLRDPRLALIDARSAAEFSGGPDHMAGERPGHIPGAVNLEWEITFDGTGRLLASNELRELFISAGYAPGDQLVVYCTVGMRASHLYFVARHLGLTPRLYLGSMNDWISDPARQVVRAESR
jgi:thiosulfate/3-mercaptopyruvate sulfurtransferase